MTNKKKVIHKLLEQKYKSKPFGYYIQVDDSRFHYNDEEWGVWHYIQDGKEVDLKTYWKKEREIDEKNTKEILKEFLKGDNLIP